MEIKDIKVYNDWMHKSLIDKLFFLQFVNCDTFVDFGCADGHLLKCLREQFPDLNLIGYDISDEMLHLAEKNLEGMNVKLLNDFTEIQKIDLSNATLILSSVIHEVYSYGNADSIHEFWDRVFNNGFKYIAVRDLMIRRYVNRPSDINDIIRILHNANNIHLTDFQNVWGSIDNNKNLVHFLMKYKWVDNWSREVLENYFPIYTEEFLSKIPNNYIVDYFDEFTGSGTLQGIKNDFGIMLKDKTHIKTVLRRL